MSIYYWLDELEFKRQNPSNIRIRDLVEYRLTDYARDYYELYLPTGPAHLTLQDIHVV